MIDYTKAQLIEELSHKQASRRSKPIRAFVSSAFGASASIAGTIKELAETAELSAMQLKYEALQELFESLEPAKPTKPVAKKSTTK